MRPRRHWFSAFFALWLTVSLVTACGPSPTSTPTPTPVRTPTPTVTPSPTALPIAEWMEEADELLRQSDFDGAEATYERVIEAQDDYGPAHVGLSWVYLWQTGLEEEGLAQAKQAVESAPDSAEAYAALAEAQIVQAAPSEAVDAAEHAVELDEESALAQAVLARAYLLDRQYESAQQAAEQAVSLGPELAPAYYSLGVFYHQTADFARAGAAFERAVSLEPTFAPWQEALGNLFLEKGMYDEATTYLEKALELAPHHASAMLGLATVSMERYAFEEAETRIQRAIEWVPDAPDPYVVWGQLHLAQDNYDEALTQFRQALTEDEDDWQGQLGVGTTYLYQEECDNAADLFQELTIAQPRFAGGQVGLGFAKLCGGDVNKALEYFRKALDLEPSNATAQMGLAAAYARQDRAEEATSAYVEALRLSPFGVDVHNELGYAFALQGDVDSAKAEYEIALNLKPDSVVAHVGLGDIFMLYEDDNAKAQHHAEQALASETFNLGAQQTLGMALVLQGKTEEGIQVLDQIIEEEPENPLARFYRGLAYRDRGDYAQAKSELETYLSLNPSDPDEQRISLLIEALGQGYTLSEDKAVSDLAEVLEYVLEKNVEVSVEEEDVDRTLVVSLATDATAEQEDVLREVGVVAGVTSLLAPRIDPEIESGLLIRFNKWGQPMVKVQASLSDLRAYADTVISDHGLLASLQFSRVVATEGPASVEDVEEDVAETRELSPEASVPHHSLTSEDLETYLTSSMDARTREATRASEALLTLLGVIAPSVDLEELLLNLYAEEIAGFYDPEEAAFYIVEDEEYTASDQMVVAHEYVHALQDQHYDLEAMTTEAQSADQRRAFDALVEGDATLAMSLYASYHIPLVDQMESVSKAGGLESDALDTSPAYIRGMELFPYQDGLFFVASLYDSGGWEAVDAAYEDPPQSTEQVLHPERYRKDDEPQEVSLSALPDNLTDGWQEVESDVLGELGLRLTLAQYVGPAGASVAAKGWGGDRYVLLQQGSEGPYALALRTSWDDQEEAVEFWELYQVYMAHRRDYVEGVEDLVGEVVSHQWQGEGTYIHARQNGRHVDIIVGPDQETVDQILTALDEA